MQKLADTFNFKFIKKFLFQIVLIGIFLPVSSHALTGSTTCSDPAATQNVTLGDQWIPGPASTNFGTIGKNTTLYHQIYIPVEGNVTVDFTNEASSNKPLTFKLGTACDSSAYGSYTLNPGVTSTSKLLANVPKGTTIYVAVVNSNANAQEYHFHVAYDSPIIVVELQPSTKSVPEGFTSIDLDIILNRGAVNGDVNVTYIRTDNNTAHSIIIPKWYDTGVLTVDINTSDPRMVQGYDFNITLLSATIIPDPTISATKSEEAYILPDFNTSVITIGEVQQELSLIKGASTAKAKLENTFYYSIAVANIGTAPAEGVAVTDTMPTSLLPYISQIVGSGWDCASNPVPHTNPIVCHYANDLMPGETKVIQFFIQLPAALSGGAALLGTTPLNSATVTSTSTDYDIRNNTDTAKTTIVSVNYVDTNLVDEMCYTDITKNLLSPTDLKKCKKVGNFYYSNGCTATVQIIPDSNLTTSLSNVQLTKMYAPQLVNGTCSTTYGTCSGYQAIDIQESPSYKSGYVFSLGSVAKSASIKLTDYNSYDGNPNNPKNLDGIGIYATYTYQGVEHHGRIKDCSGLTDSGIEILASADTIDTNIGADGSLAAVYNASKNTSHDPSKPYSDTNGLKWIQTMVASNPARQISGVHLDIDSLQATTYSYGGDPKNYSDFVMMPYIVDETNEGYCIKENAEPLTDNTGTQIMLKVPEGYYSPINPATFSVPFKVRQRARLQTIVVDPNTLSTEGQSCLANSSTGGNIEGIGQCGNSEIHYVGGFGVDAWDRCGLNNGDPCLSSNHGRSGGGNPAYPGYNSFYDNPLGCYMCTFDIQPACSTDDFSIRPARLDMNITHADAPKLLRAGKNYGVSLKGRDFANSITTDYTVTDHNYANDLEGTETIKFFKDNTKDTQGLLYGTADFNRSVAGYMVNGLSSTTVNAPGSAQEALMVFYTDVGKLDLFVADTQWSAVDNDDTPADCNSSTHYYVCGDMNVTFIPHHFDFTELNITNHGGPDNNFTYLANAAQQNEMSAKVQTHIRAMNKLGGVTQNFRNGNDPKYYENNVTIMPTINDASSFDTNKDGVYGDAHESNVTDKFINFTLGERTILWNEPITGTEAAPLNFNFKRDNDTPVNPFDVDGSSLKISIDSNYTDGSKTADINGSRDGNNTTKVTFYYGRAKSSKFFYDDVLGNRVTTPISVVVYCDTFPTCTQFSTNMQTNGRIDEPYWWLALDHNQSRTPLTDGSITLTVSSTEPSGSATVSPTNPFISNAIDPNVEVRDTSGTYPMTAYIKHNGTSAWLIYNPFSPTLDPDPFYKVRFIGQTGWAGVGITGNVVDTNASTSKTQRMNW